MSKKVGTIRKKLDEIQSLAHLEVDGGISAETLPRMRDAGANVFVAGTAIFKHPQGIEAGIKALRECQ
jgi:ribulose-phosphate 3-epimerase